MTGTLDITTWKGLQKITYHSKKILDFAFSLSHSSSSTREPKSQGQLGNLINEKQTVPLEGHFS
jgi:hypothetical protein